MTGAQWRVAAQVTVKVVLGILNAFGIVLAVSLWWLRLSGRLDNEVDAPEIVLLYAIVTAAAGFVALPLAALAVRAGWVARWWLAIPLAVLLAASISVCSVAGDL